MGIFVSVGGRFFNRAEAFELLCPGQDGNPSLLDAANLEKCMNKDQT